MKFWELKMSGKHFNKPNVHNAPVLTVSCDEVATETPRPDAVKHVVIENEAGGGADDNAAGRKVSRDMMSPTRKVSRPGLGQRHSTLAVALEKRRGSNVCRSHFLRSFGQTDLRFHNIERDEEEILHQSPLEMFLNTEQNEEKSKEKEKAPRPDVYTPLKRRAFSAGPVLRTGSQTQDFSIQNLLDIRGSEYSGYAVDLDIKARLRKQSAKRRIRRITEADRLRQEKEEKEEEEKVTKEEPKKRFTFRGATLAVMMMRGPGSDSVQERKKMLAAKRLASKKIVSKEAGWSLQ